MSQVFFVKNIRSSHGNADFKCLCVALLGLARLRLMVKNPPANAGNLRDEGSILGSGRPPGEENGNPLQYSSLENPMDGGAWWTTVHGSQRVDTTERLHFHFHFPLS